MWVGVPRNTRERQGGRHMVVAVRLLFGTSHAEAATRFTCFYLALCCHSTQGYSKAFLWRGSRKIKRSGGGAQWTAATSIVLFRAGLVPICCYVCLRIWPANISPRLSAPLANPKPDTASSLPFFVALASTRPPRGSSGRVCRSQGISVGSGRRACGAQLVWRTCLWSPPLESGGRSSKTK